MSAPFCTLSPYWSPKPTLALQVLTPEECEQFVKATETLGYTEAPITTGRGPVMMTGTRKQATCKFWPNFATFSASFSRLSSSGIAQQNLLTVTTNVDIRNNKRVMWQISDEDLLPIWERVCEFMPKTFRTSDRSTNVWQLNEDRGLNERFRFYRYEANDYFAPHYDGCYARNGSEQSHFTFIVRYLSMKNNNLFLSHWF